jgi:hypothetical protein
VDADAVPSPPPLRSSSRSENPAVKGADPSRRLLILMMTFQPYPFDAFSEKLYPHN